MEDIDLQLTVLKKILDHHLSVRNVEQLVRQLAAGTKQPATSSKSQSASPDPETKKLQTDLSSFLGTRITLKSDKNSKGEIRIPFYSVEDLERILEIIEFK